MRTHSSQRQGCARCRLPRGCPSEPFPTPGHTPWCWRSRAPPGRHVPRVPTGCRPGPSLPITARPSGYHQEHLGSSGVPGHRSPTAAERSVWTAAVEPPSCGAVPRPCVIELSAFIGAFPSMEHEQPCRGVVGDRRAGSSRRAASRRDRGPTPSVPEPGHVGAIGPAEEHHAMRGRIVRDTDPRTGDRAGRYGRRDRAYRRRGSTRGWGHHRALRPLPTCNRNPDHGDGNGDGCEPRDRKPSRAVAIYFLTIRLSGT
jgi:hypothetical protein